MPTTHFRSHERSHGVVYESARNDLLDLESRGLVLRRKLGQTHHFNPHPELEERLREMGELPAGIAAAAQHAS